MEAKTSIKLKRHKKRKSRTEVSSESDSEPEKAAKIVKRQTSEPNDTQEPAPKSSKRRKEKSKVATAQSQAQAPPDPTEAISAAFKSYYMQHATTEFADDLNAIRGADDFRGEALDILVQVLQQGTDMFSMEEKTRVVGAGVKQPWLKDR